MSFSEWTKKRQQQNGGASAAQQTGTRATASSSATNIARDDKPSSFGEWTRKNQGVTAWRDEEVGFNQWLEQMSRFSSKAGSDYQSRVDSYQSADDITKYRDDTYRSLDALSKTGQDYRTYFQAYKSMYDEMYGAETTQQILSALDEGSKYLDSLRGGVDSAYTFWSQFQDEDDYNTYKKGQEYASLTDAPDFAEKSQYVSTYQPGTEKFNAFSGTYTNSGFGDINYDYINRDETARSRQMLSDIQSNASLLGLDNSERGEMTDDEIAIFNYLYAQDTANGDTEHSNAYAYIDYLTKDLNYRQRAKAEEEWAAYANEHPVGSSVFSVLESPLKGISYLGQFADYTADGKIDQNAPSNKFSYIPTAIRNEVSETIQNSGKWGGVGSFAYQTGMSMGDFLFNTAITGGNQALTLAIMGTGAAADATIDAKDRGLDDTRSFVLGTIAGAAEIVTEKFSLDALLKLNLEKGALRYIIKNMITEGSEEGVSNAINWIADGLYDVITSQDQSEWKQMVSAYMEQGLSESEATGCAFADRARELGLDMLGGALSGGVLAGGSTGINNAGTYQTGKQFNSMDLSAEDVQAFIDEGLASDPSSQAYKLAVSAQQKIAAGGTLTDYEMGNLYQANVRAIGTEDDGAALLTRAAQDVAGGKNITNRTASDILDNTRAVSILTKDAGLSLTDDMTKSQRRAAVKSAIEALASRSNAVSEPTSEITQTTEKQTQAAQESTPVTSRPVAQQAYDIKRVQRAASALGENGAKALTTAYDGGADADSFYAGFASYYEAGVSGMDMGKVQSEYSGQLNQAQKYAAYVAGKNDAAASLAAERAGTNFVTVYGDEAGLVQNDYVAKLPKETAALYNRLARAGGVKIELADSVRGGTANGEFLPGKNTIRLAMDADNALDVVAAHEITHRLQQLAPEAYRKYRDYVMNYRTGQNQGGSASIVEAYRSNAADAGVNLTTEEAMDEIAADFTQELIENKDLFGELAKKDRSIAGKLLDAIKEFIAKVKSVFRGNAAAQDQAARSEYGVDMKTLEEAARLWTEAYNAAEGQAKSAKKADTESATSQKASPTAAATENEKGNPKFSTKRSIESYQAELETAKQELAVIESADVFHLEAAGYTSFTEWDKKRESAKRKVRRIEAKIKELSRPEFESAGTIDSKAFKAWFGDWRNPDARKSKVVDVDGKPLVVYHGTGTTIEEFLPELTGKGNDQYGSGFYFTSDKSTAEGYTTATINGQKKLGGDDNPNVIPVYLNIRNPLVVDGKKTPNLYGDDTRVSPAKAYSIIFKHPDIMDKENSILGDFFDTYWETGPKKYMISQLANDYEWTLGTLETDIFSGYPEEFHRAVKEAMGYDGVQVNLAGGEKHFVAWFPNQIKHATENSGAFSKNDNRIKYSLKTDSEGRKLTDEQREFFKDSKLLDDDGRLMVMYHGTTAYGEITKFKRGRSGWLGPGIYLSSRQSDAQRYADAMGYGNGSVYELYANVTNPLTVTQSNPVPEILMAAYGREGVYKARSAKQSNDTNILTPSDIKKLQSKGYDGIVWKFGKSTEVSVFSPEQLKRIDNQKPTSSSDIRYSLKPVPPVRPKSKDWRPGATFDEVKSAHPTLFALDADEADTRNPTQISGTVKSYRKIYDALKAEGFDGTILDASSGLGYGTRAGREEYGFQVDDIEPFPDEKYKPMFTDYSTLEKTYDVIINNAVLNVMPQDLRDALVVKMGEMLKPGGRAFINVRGTDVKNASSKVAINDDLMEYFISNTGSYQKGFTQRELVAYLKDALGDGFSVEPTKKFGGVSAIVTKDGRNSLKGTGNIQREMAALSEENDLLRDRVDYWKGQTKRTQRVTTDKKAVTQAARDLIRSYGADLETSEIAGDLQSLYDYISSGYDGKDELTYADARRRAEKIARTLVDNAVAVDADQYRQYSDLRSYLRSTKLTLSNADSSNIADYNDFRKRNFGRLNLGGGSTNVDQVYLELSEMWPEFFDEQRESHPADQILHIADVLDSIYDVTEYNPFSHFIDQATTARQMKSWRNSSSFRRRGKPSPTGRPGSWTRQKPKAGSRSSGFESKRMPAWRSFGNRTSSAFMTLFKKSAPAGRNNLTSSRRATARRTRRAASAGARGSCGLKSFVTQRLCLKSSCVPATSSISRKICGRRPPLCWMQSTWRALLPWTPIPGSA
jgi:hypothetical protein